MSSMFNALYLFSFFMIFSASFYAEADEKVGTFSIDEINLRPTLTSVEDQGGQFDLSDSSVAFMWSKEKNLSVRLGLGSTLSRNLPIYYNDPNANEFGIYEGYAQYDGIYGRLRFGLVPLEFGYDGIVKSNERYFKRSLPVSERLIGLRDYGLSFYTENNGYYTELIVHNGEVDTTSDGRLWTTANWGFANGRTFRTQLSLQTGYVKGSISAATPAADAVAGVTPGQTTRWRNGLFFVNWHPRDWNAVLQMGGGEAEQDSGTGRYSANLFELTRLFSKNFGVGFRYDQFDPNSKLSGDMKTEASLLFLFKSDDSTSNFYLLGTKVIEEKNEVPNDELRLVWLLTPYTH